MTRFRIEDIVHPEMHMVAKQFVCAICLNIVEEPVQTACSHIFCRACLSPCTLCPSCREPVDSNQVKGLGECNKPMMRLMQDIKVHCPYQNEAACTSLEKPSDKAVGDQASELQSIARPLKQARTHKDEVSEESDVPTPCDWTGSYGDLLVKHLQECPHHWITCPLGCGASFRRRHAASHSAVCAKSFEKCNICGKQVRPEDMATHRKDAAELHVQILEEKLASKANQAESEVTLSDRLLQVEKSITSLAKTSYVGETIKRRTDEVKDEIKQELWDCMRKKIAWKIDNWPSVHRLKRRGQYLTSNEFTLRGYPDLILWFYPNGDTSPDQASDEGWCSLWVWAESAKDDDIVFEATISPHSGVVHKMKLPAGHSNSGWPNFCKVPSTSLESLEITLKLIEYAEKI